MSSCLPTCVRGWVEGVSSPVVGADGAIGPELADAATFIFLGTVLAPGEPSVRILAGRPGLVLARFERAFRVNPMLGDLTGQRITVGLPPGATVREGENVVFFANSWVHGEAIAVSALAYASADADSEGEVLKALAALPGLYRERRVASADLIVQGTVGEVRAADIEQPISEHMAQWMQAEVAVAAVLKGRLPEPSSGAGEATASVTVWFPEDTDSSWGQWPKLTRGQRAVFLLHHATRRPLPPTALTLPDPDDVQPSGKARAIRVQLKRQDTTGDQR
jgi:hypothetical protein